MPLRSVSRRHALKLLGSVAALPLMIETARAQAAVGRLIVLSDLHSAYERSAQLLAAVAAEIEASPTAHAILINGDVFELGNVVATRSAGAADWLLLERLAALAPTVLNIGNHEPDLIADLAEVIAKASSLGITLVSNIVDTRTGAPYADAVATIDVGGMPVTVVGIATAALNTYPAATRDWLTLPDPVAWASENLPAVLADAVQPVVLSHAGVVADRAILPLLPDGTLLVGGHDHLVLEHAEGNTRYVHTGSWSSVFTIVEIGSTGIGGVARVEVDRNGPADEEIAAVIAEALATHLTPEETAIIGQSEAARSLSDSARFAATALAAAAWADVGFIGHTTFGTGFPSGDVSKYVFDSVVRFDGKLVTAEVDRATLDELLARANQDGDLPLEARTGDFLYAAPVELADKAIYVIAANDWSAINQKNYFGREDLVFTEVPDLRVKAVVAAALQ